VALAQLAAVVGATLAGVSVEDKHHKPYAILVVLGVSEHKAIPQM
jgi:hypothetical protein